jgi:hypothetical protein
MIELLGGQYHENGDSRRLAFLLLAGSVASAQVAATIDSRGFTPSFPSVHITGGTGESSTSAGAKALQLTFTLLDPRQLSWRGLLF